MWDLGGWNFVHLSEKLKDPVLLGILTIYICIYINSTMSSFSCITNEEGILCKIWVKSWWFEVCSLVSVLVELGCSEAGTSFWKRLLNGVLYLSAYETAVEQQWKERCATPHVSAGEMTRKMKYVLLKIMLIIIYFKDRYKRNIFLTSCFSRL